MTIKLIPSFTITKHIPIIKLQSHFVLKWTKKGL